MRDKPTMRGLLVTLAIAALSGCGGEEPPAPDTVPAAEAPTAPAVVQAQDARPTDTEAAASPVADPDGEAAGSREDPPPADAVVAAPTPEWQPEQTSVEVASVEEMIEQAEVAMQAGRFEYGDGNALSLYQAILASEPDNAAATDGIARIVQALTTRVETALSDRLYDDASTMLATLGKLRPDDSAVADLKARAAAGHEIKALLVQAQRLAKAGRIVEPEEGNAATTYAEVLKRDPKHPDALSGLARLESDLVASATAAAEAGDYARSDQLLSDAARLQPGSGSVQDASTEIVELRQDRASELLQQAHAAADGGDVRRAEQLLGQLEQVSVQSQGIEELRQSIERARIYGGFAPGQALSDALSSGEMGPELVVIPAGRYEMGSPSSESDRKKNEGPRHAVTLRRGFALARAEITVAQFRAFVKATKYVSSAQHSGRSTIYDERTGTLAERPGVDWERDHSGIRAAPDLPVVHVSWNDAKAYADWLSRETGKGYRLPSEAEFEYVLRAGNDARYPWGDGHPSGVVGNMTGDKDRSVTNRTWSNAFRGYGDGHWGAAPVRTYPANAFGVHDSNGNVAEWVEDCWHDNYSRAPTDGSAWVNPGCAMRVIRGASWASSPDQARSAFRVSATPVTSNARVGFRVLREL